MTVQLNLLDIKTTIYVLAVWHVYVATVTGVIVINTVIYEPDSSTMPIIVVTSRSMPDRQ